MTAVSDLGAVIVAVLTYQRRDDLLQLLPQLDAQIEAAGEDLEVDVLVVDNDPEASARATVAEAQMGSVRYVHEPKPGIAHARNRALDEAGDAHLLIFIDDDERPADGWLGALLDSYRATGSAAVVGPVLPAYSAPPDPWIQAGGFFVRKRYPTGTVMPAAATNNLLIDLRQLDQLGGLRFDERFGLTGGSDTLFTRLLISRGGEIVWCDEAAVLDQVPTQRLSRRWVLRRAFRSGNSWSRTTLELSQSPWSALRARLRMTVLGLARVVVGGLRGVAGLAGRSPHHHARGSRSVARGLGMMRGAWGFVYEEYRRDPSPGSHSRPLKHHR